MNNNVHEAITKCQQTAALLEGDIVTAYVAASNVGNLFTHRDNALVAYLAERLATIRKLQSDLLNLGSD